MPNDPADAAIAIASLGVSVDTSQLDDTIEKLKLIESAMERIYEQKNRLAALNDHAVEITTEMIDAGAQEMARLLAYVRRQFIERWNRHAFGNLPALSVVNEGRGLAFDVRHSDGR